MSDMLALLLEGTSRPHRVFTLVPPATTQRTRLETETMPMPAHPLPQGIWGTILLPVDKHDQIDWGALAEELEVLTASDLAGIYANGTAGEFHNQTEAEYERLVGLVAQQAQAAGMPFQIGGLQHQPTHRPRAAAAAERGQTQRRPVHPARLVGTLGTRAQGIHGRHAGSRR